MAANTAAARDFVFREARLLEQRLYLTVFEGAPAGGVVEALRGYRNDDGGFGHGLEPDKRCPESQPLDVLVALGTMDTVDAVDADLARKACDFLATVADDRGAVPSVLPSIAAYPRAEHWEDGDFPPGLSPALGITAVLHAHAIEHPWRDPATAYCLTELEREPPTDAHVLREALLFFDCVPAVPEALVERVAGALRNARWFKADPADPAYGLGPLEFATEPSSRWRELFTQDEIDASLDHLEADQEEDGGWPLAWQPPSEASVLEWRGIWTIKALRVLCAYGRC